MKMINITKELNDVHKEMLKEEIKNKLTEILIEKLQEKVKQNIQNQLIRYQDSTNVKFEKTEEQVNDNREDFSKLPNEIKGDYEKRYI
jgi:hypothetical protein